MLLNRIRCGHGPELLLVPTARDDFIQVEHDVGGHGPRRQLGAIEFFVGRQAAAGDQFLGRWRSSIVCEFLLVGGDKSANSSTCGCRQGRRVEQELGSLCDGVALAHRSLR